MTKDLSWGCLQSISQGTRAIWKLEWGWSTCSNLPDSHAWQIGARWQKASFLSRGTVWMSVSTSMTAIPFLRMCDSREPGENSKVFFFFFKWDNLISYTLSFSQYPVSCGSVLLCVEGEFTLGYIIQEAKVHCPVRPHAGPLWKLASTFFMKFSDTPHLIVACQWEWLALKTGRLISVMLIGLLFCYHLTPVCKAPPRIGLTR